ncbi:MAG TPA: cytochrome c oxidase subunit 3 [Denitromonas sp.]|uniref:cytochrome c oxidase subunit 3 n=1 Tax=Denitromonas sp. TaxID=2734609 RepID=UPI001D83402B|nr:cytochrome c oxidase subunit 3 [Rhodocyclaceae bacterium]MCP5221587.1 cytochrome c oxidase subunit 3 [Zoogloeaceae bacterium]HPR07528.1 cytochrome c oxidase subunit 3 [Denitromonas sp.]HQU88201.1 cytochrome c oxidase subunit 3 [Denitromonas sp.]HQV14428.1 cytochrome c oxidase subunit 3 [Denitromonas sp.]
MSPTFEKYFVPEPSKYPIFGAFALLCIGSGSVMWLNHTGPGPLVFFVGLATLIYMLFGWFGQVIRESEGGQYGKNVDASFRWSMGWFIFSEVMFFAAFFGVLFYVRVIAVPSLGSEESVSVLWQGFEAVWPTAGPRAEEAFSPMAAWGIPALNTLILLTSGATLTWAHWGMMKDNRAQLKLGLLLTVLLGVLFMSFQIYEYMHAYGEMNLKMTSGIYGSTFYMMTGFHGLHVTIGAIMLLVMLFRVMAGHFTKDHHFAFEAAAWYWHFVDVVWLVLFVVVYWL